MPKLAAFVKTDVVQLLRELVALPSVNPAFVPPGDPRGGEQRVADFLVAVGARAGLDVEFQAVQPGRANVLLRLAPRAKIRQTIWLAPHLDTVPDLAPGQLMPAVRHGKLFGRGACDTKGSVAAMLAALLDMAQSSRRPQSTEIIFAGLVDEEGNQSGSRALAASGRRADLAIVGEPTRCQVVTAHKGDLWLTLTTRGQAAHGSTPELGRNAVLEMARIVALLETTYARQLRRRKHPLLGVPTINVGRIQGGSQPNIVPNVCTIQVDRRLLPGERLSQVRRELADLLRQHGLRAAISDHKHFPCPAMETDVRRPWVRQFMAAANCHQPLGVPFFCDAAILAAAGTPSVVFGPGDIAQAHTANEWITVAELKKSTDILRRFLASLP